MKKILSLLFLLAAFGQVFCQNTDPARESTGLLVKKYSLNLAQADRMYKIQLRKQRNLSEIEGLKMSDPALYLAKLSSIQRGTQAGIGRLLNNQAQRDLFQQTQTEQRRLRAEKRLEMEARGVASDEIEAILLGIYLE